MSLPKVCSTKGFQIGTATAGIIALALLTTFVIPNVSDNADAISELKTEHAVTKQIQEDKTKQLDGMDKKLDKLVILSCIENKDHSLCN